MPVAVLLTGYAAWLIALATLYYAVPGWQVATWPLIGISAAIAVLVGVRRNRPPLRWPWMLIAAAMVTYVTGDTVAALFGSGLGEFGTVATLVNVLYLGMFGVLAVGLTALARSHPAGRQHGSLLDAVTLAVGVGLLSWVYLISLHVDNENLPALDRIAAIGYPVGDVLILAMVARVVTVARWSVATALLLLGVLFQFGGDMFYLLARVQGTWEAGGPVDASWMIFYATWGAAALHPSMAALADGHEERSVVLTGRRLVLLALCSLIAPAVLFAQAMNGRVTSGGVIALASVAMFTLVLARLFDAMRTHELALARERGLRAASADLVAATDVDQVAAAVQAAVHRLLPTGAGHHTLLAVPDPGLPWVPDPAEFNGATPLVGQPDPGGRPELALRIKPTDRRVLVEPRTLPRAEAAELTGFEHAIRVPLALNESHPARIVVLGDLVVGAATVDLANLRDSLVVLAAQAALALERIRLGDEIDRQHSEAYFRALVQNSADVILIVEDDNLIRYASPAAAGLLGRPITELVGLPVLSLLDPDSRGPADRLLAAVRSGAGSQDVDWAVVRHGSDPAQVEVSCRDLRADPTVRGLVLTLRDVTQRRQLEQELTHHAYHDALTGLPNRLLFTERTAEAVGRLRGTRSLAGVLFIDLDDFKVINDTLGHATGDELLTAAAARLRGLLNPPAVPARLGGDEFAALVEGTDMAAIEAVAERIVAALSSPFVLGDHLISGAASVGIATTADANDAGELLRQADLALYLAKGSGKNQWRRYQPDLHAAILDRLRLRADLEVALTDRQFGLRFQPIVRLSDGVTVGFEALVRWDHPSRGPVLPGEFIDLAEQTGLIVPIGYQVLDQAVNAAAGWIAHAGPAAPYVSINVSARQFRTPGFVDTVQRCLADGLPTRNLMLEITESLLLRDNEHVWADLAALRQLGVRVAIDDFGTGYSSLSYLRHVPLDVVKIDRSFIGALEGSLQQRALVDGIVQLAQTLDLDVVAEGIETPTERAILDAMGCPYGQGYLFAKPMTFGEAVLWLNSPARAA